MINILYITGWGNLMGGGPISLLSLLKKLDRERFKPLVICPSSGTLVDALKSIDIEVKIIEIKPLKRFHLFPFFSSIVKLSKLIKEERIDIVHSNAVCSRESFAGAIAAKIAKVPFLYHARVVDSAGWIEKILVKLSTVIVAISDAVGRRFHSFRDRQRLIKIYNGIDMEEFNPGISQEEMRRGFGLDSDTVVIGTAGLVIPLKGLQYFLKAAAEIVKRYPSVKFLVVGETLEGFEGHKRELEDLADSLMINKKVIFAGFRRDFPRILAGIDIFVLSSIKEGFGRVLVEAMAMEKPVVATWVGGIPEVVENGVTGILVPPKDPEAITKAIVDLIRDKDRAKGMGLAGRKRAKELFNIDTNVQKTTELYARLCRS